MCKTVGAKLAKEDAWIKDLDLVGFGAEMKALGKKLQREQGPEDAEHLKKMVNWSRIATVIGLLTLWVYPNPITVFCLSLGTFMRWTMIGHHTCHGGYENVDTTCVGGPTTYKRFIFAWGSLYRRVIDWMDWMLPEAWDMEHNRTHHYKLGEIEDPDLVENNLVDLRNSNVPLFVKYLTVGFFMMTWKWFYYAPNTYKCLKYAELRRDRMLTKSMIAKKEESVTVKGLIAGTAEGLSLTEFIVRIVGPVFIYNFIVLPLPVWFLFGETAYYYAMTNLFLAEILTNIHAFIAIVTNHAGDDLYRFDTPCRAHTPTFYLRAIISSANFSSGTDVIDVAHGFLNYQIEHHSWPFLSMRSYQKAAPQVEAICKKYGVPYVKHNVFWRLKKTVDIMVGNTKMRTWPEGVVDETKFR
mmetsp:Transcript_7937/g.15622  ORF Transcript_7937/g.15622 Transcript_7937/m.15622 type:complete len:411 (-) Transcript_7937:246-1478(-)